MQTKNFRRFLALILSVSLMCGILPMTVLADTAGGTTVTLDYVDGDGTTVVPGQECTPITATDTVWNGDNATSGWYAVVGQSLTIDARIEVVGDVKIILAADGPLFVSNGVHVGPGSSLTVYEAKDVGSYHGLQVTNSPEPGAAAFGGNKDEVNGTITFNGGIIVANAICASDVDAGAGIGTGANASGTPGVITINPGVDSLSASSYPGGAGIGGGCNSNSGLIVINGGDVTARGNQGGAGIGGGAEGICDVITINGGKVNAQGGTYGPGIGAGQLRNSNTAHADETLIKINGGSVTVTAGSSNTKALVTGTLGEKGGLFYAKYSIYDDARILVGNQLSGEADTLELNPKNCANYRKLKIDPCSHEEGERYIPTPDGHIVACATCRHEIRSESHTDEDGNNVCDICGSVVNATYMVTFDSNGGSNVPSQEIHVNDVATRPQDPTKAGCVLLGWKLGDSYFDFDTPITDDITLVADWDAAYVATAVSATVLFESSLQLRYTMRFSDALLADENAYIQFTKCGSVIASYNLSQYSGKSADGYQYCVAVAPAEWRDYVVCEVFYGPDATQAVMRNVKGEQKENNQVIFGYYEYESHFYDGDEPTSDFDFLCLARYGLHYYCRFSQLYFNYQGDRPNDDTTIDEPYTDLVIDEDYRLKKSGDKPAGLVGTSTVLNFKSSNTLRVIFTLEDGKSAEDYDFLLKDCEGNTVTTTAISLGNNRYALETNGIDAPNLVKTFTFSISAKGSSDAYTISASAMSYAIMAMEKGSSDYMKYLGRALYMYGYYAHAYFEGDQ